MACGWSRFSMRIQQQHSVNIKKQNIPVVNGLRLTVPGRNKQVSRKTRWASDEEPGTPKNWDADLRA